ncbi:MAG TPA: hypothetical protein VFX96_17185 [Pyrinomonadaceae bacterium]|nr:hypothetical protein [Pyrinomonadaceae bacterium]
MPPTDVAQTTAAALSNADSDIEKVLELLKNELKHGEVYSEGKGKALRDKVELELYKAKAREKEKGKTNTETAIDLLKTEYAQAAERYENIYKAIWTNFSYLSVIAGGILTFGNNAIGDTSFTALLACVPLLFWYAATFVPLNRYGKNTEERLAHIESIAKEKHGVSLSHFSGFHKLRKSWLYTLTRVRFVMWFFISLLSLGAASLFWQSFMNDSPRLTPLDLKDPEGFIQRLEAQKPPPPTPTPLPGASTAATPEPTDKAAHFIYSRLSESTRKMVNEYDRSVPPSNQFLQGLVIDMNRVIEDELLHDQEPFKSLANRENDRIQRPQKTQEWVEVNRKLVDRAFAMNVKPYEPVSSLRQAVSARPLTYIPFLGVSVYLAVILLWEFVELIRDVFSPKKKVTILALKSIEGAEPSLEPVTLKWPKDKEKLEGMLIFKMPEAMPAELMDKSSTLKIITLEQRGGDVQYVPRTYEDIEKMLTEAEKK